MPLLTVVIFGSTVWGLRNTSPRDACVNKRNATLDATLSNIDLLHRWYEEIWNKGNYAVIAELMAPDVQFGGPVSSLVQRRDDYAEVIQTFKALMPDMHVEITHALEQGDMACVRVVVNRKQNSIHSDIAITGQLMVRVENQRFVEFMSDFNYFQMYAQLGQLPEDAMAICLTGDRLVWANQPAPE